jgi:hypothetical protein
MTLPTEDEIQRILSDRPGDELYPEVKPWLAQIAEKEATIKNDITSLIINDMIYDLAFYNSLDEVGKVLEYLSQDRQTHTPDFAGESLMKNFSRISKLKLSLEFANLVKLTGAPLEMLLKAEVDRLWGSEANNVLSKLLLQKALAGNPAPIAQSPAMPMYKKKEQ